MGNQRCIYVECLKLASIYVHDLGTSDVRGVLILQVSCLAFSFHMQALHFASFIFAVLRSLAKLV